MTSGWNGSGSNQRLGMIIMTCIAVLLASLEWNFAKDRVDSMGVVLEDSIAARRSGTLTTTVRNDLAGKSVIATLSSWYVGYKAGDRVELLTSTTNPSDVIAASFRQRHFASMSALAIALGFAAWLVSKGVKRRVIAEDSVLGDNPDYSEAVRCLDAG